MKVPNRAGDGNWAPAMAASEQRRRLSRCSVWAGGDDDVEGMESVPSFASGNRRLPALG